MVQSTTHTYLRAAPNSNPTWASQRLLTPILRARKDGLRKRWKSRLAWQGQHARCYMTRDSGKRCRTNLGESNFDLAPISPAMALGSIWVRL